MSIGTILFLIIGAAINATVIMAGLEHKKRIDERFYDRKDK